MSILQARGLALRFAQAQPLFHGVDFEINPGDRIALIGPNGTGKTSLLRILTGEQPPDSGKITRRRGLAVASFQQTDRHGLDTAGSAGQRSRARLALALDQPADLLLLDEPTNHLDAKTRAWLQHEILRRKRTCLFVSHDEDFLNAVATRVFELRRSQFREFTGNYESFQTQSEIINQRNWSGYETEQRQLAALEKAARQRNTLSVKVAHTPPGGRISKAFYGHKAAKVARTARLLRERLPRETRHAKPWEDQPIPTLDFKNYLNPADPPIQLQNLTLAYEQDPIINNLTLTIRRGERWVVRGPNGSGKTTLFRAIRNELPPNSGAIQLGHNVKLGYFAQEAETLDPNETPLQSCLRECPDLTWVRTILACLKLLRDYADVPIRQLSLGERARTALAQILVSGANVLLLDEPTNHLEIEARHALTETLRQWKGTILFASHDEAFAQAIATHSVVFPFQHSNLA